MNPAQSVSHQAKPARQAKRVYAWTIDFLLFWAIWLAAAWIGLAITQLEALAAYLLLIVIPLTAIRGQAPGQVVMGLAVVDLSGRRPPSPLRATAHVVLSLLLAPLNMLLFIFLDWLMTVRFGGSQAEAGAAAVEAMPGRLLHDRVAGTLVVQLPHADAGEADPVAAYMATVEAGGQYRCRPDRTGSWLALWLVVGAAFGSLSLLGMSYNGPSPPGLAFLAVLTIGPGLAVLGLLLVRRNSGYRLSTEELSRRDWLGRVVASYPNAEVVSVRFVPGGTGTSWSEMGVGWAEFEVEHPERFPVVGLKSWYLPESPLTDSDQSELSAWQIWWSDARFNDFRRVFDGLRAAGHISNARGHRNDRGRGHRKVRPPRLT